MRLEEGRYYIFTKVKNIVLPGGEVNLMLTGPDGKKYLLPLERYNDYNLETKTEIECKVDKINCSGKVFLEPEHPYYREGESYFFTLTGTTAAGTNSGGDHIVEVSDFRGGLFNVSASLLKENIFPGSRVKLRVERISKGKIIFAPPVKRDDLDTLEEGRSYRFRVDRTIFGTDYETYYVVIDLNGKEHLLNTRYYSHYGLTPGGEFTGRVIRYSHGRGRSIEPDNPWYLPGQIIEVTVGSSVASETGDGFITEVFDGNGFSHSLLLESIPLMDVLRCRVVKLKKGRPVLEPVAD
ncbi:MAG: hypothetical protein L0Y37_02065 [Bacteroidales bacterium]|nr:hypothetical protein [Bacteroidales bacterium]